MRVLQAIMILVIALTAIGCNQPKKVEKQSDAQASREGSKISKILESPIETHSEMDVKVNQVVVKEKLPATKYIYLYVQDVNTKDEYWIATRMQEIAVGGIYMYKNGLLKTNFESKEHNRIFDEIYLVNNIVAANHGSNAAVTAPESAGVSTEKIELADGSTPIADIVKSPADYANKTVQVTGVCTKINPNIMNRNWIHLKDNSDTEYDFVLTSEQFVPVGHKVTMKGTLAVNKDFGAGYKYEMILENCTTVQ